MQLPKRPGKPGLLYIPPINRRNAQNNTARENLAASANKAYILPKPHFLSDGEVTIPWVSRILY